ncbi:MAG: histidine kinase [Hyphomicrobiales bacterium]|nr:histidine kinase [Hyphomicrobiales bacterium]MBV9111893.1 histidine kinase [Hyphomicrobiales bacterium]MBV9520010.1 histidine kinase [Hyphomicrobiales bacterium]
MPTLFKLLAILVMLGCLVLGAMIALVAFVQPEHRPITVIVPLPKPKS